MEENTNVKAKKEIKITKKEIVIGVTCLLAGVGIGVFGPKIVHGLINMGTSTVADAALETGAEVAIEAATAVV